MKRNFMTLLDNCSTMIKKTKVYKKQKPLEI
jgi:hypothetical protein